MPEVLVEPGQPLRVTAGHDTYGITFTFPGHSSSAPIAVWVQTVNPSCYLECCREGRPPQALPSLRTQLGVQDPTWQEAHSRISGLTGQIAQRPAFRAPWSCVQWPWPGIQMAQRPEDLGVDAEQAADFCLKMMS